MVEELRTPFVLVVEDDRDIAALFRNVMEQAGYRTDIAVNGMIALDYIYRNAPDIILLDLSLPGITGAEILKILNADKRFRNIHTVVITGYAQMANDLQVEPDLVLEKPVSPSQLTDLVNRLCQDDKLLQKRPLLNNPLDKITGLYNRSFFTNRLEVALSNYQANPEELFGVLLLRPYDGKKPDEGVPNPKEAHYLNEIGKAIRSCLRPTDTIARFDNDGNFFMLIENVPSAKKLGEIAKRVQGVLLTQLGSVSAFNIAAIYSDDSLIEVDSILAALELQSAS